MIYFFRSDVSVKNHWKTIRKRAQRGFYRDEADSIFLDIQQFVKGEVQHFISKSSLTTSCVVFFNFYFYHFMETF